jgi:hypothetical protein
MLDIGQIASDDEGFNFTIVGEFIMDNNKMPFGFFLNVRMLYEIVKDRSIPAVLLNENDAVLTGVQYYLGQEKLSENVVYLCTAAELRRQPVRTCACASVGCAFVIAGEPE